MPSATSTASSRRRCHRRISRSRDWATVGLLPHRLCGYQPVIDARNNTVLFATGLVVDDLRGVVDQCAVCVSVTPAVNAEGEVEGPLSILV